MFQGGFWDNPETVKNTTKTATNAQQPVNVKNASNAAKSNKNTNNSNNSNSNNRNNKKKSKDDNETVKKLFSENCNPADTFSTWCRSSLQTMKVQASIDSKYSCLFFLFNVQNFLLINFI